MAKKEKNIDVLLFGLKHIAENHNTNALTENWEEERQVAIMDNSVPTLSDVQMLCDDLQIPRHCIYTSFFGIDIELPNEWVNKTSKRVF
jgi:hypothetical protein